MSVAFINHRLINQNEYSHRLILINIQLLLFHVSEQCCNVCLVNVPLCINLSLASYVSSNLTSNVSWFGWPLINWRLPLLNDFFKRLWDVVYWSAYWLFYWLAYWLIGMLLICSLACMLIGLFYDWVICWLTYQLINLLTYLLIDLFIDWLL